MSARHVPPRFGLPYAQAGVTDEGEATARCPVCDHLCVGVTHERALAAYQEHFEVERQYELEQEEAELHAAIEAEVLANEQPSDWYGRNE